MKRMKSVLMVALLTLSVSIGTVDAAQLTQYYYTDKKQVASTWNYDEATGNLDGVSTEFYRNGNVETETSYVDGVLNGVQKEFTENGLLHTEKTYTNAQLNGLYRTYNDAGKLVSETDFVKGDITKTVTYDYNKNTKHVETLQGEKWVVEDVDLTSGKILSRTETEDGYGYGQGSGWGASNELENFPVPAFPINVTVTDNMNKETTISFLVDTDYHLAHAYISESSGNVFLDEAALQVVQNWHGSLEDGLLAGQIGDDGFIHGVAMYRFNPDRTVTLEIAFVE